MDKKLYMTAMNKVRNDCEQCPHVKQKGKCPSEKQFGKPGVLSACAKAMYDYLIFIKTNPT